MKNLRNSGLAVRFDQITPA